MTHEDFEGHKGTIEAGDLQWMTAGRGIVHSEMPAAEGTQKGLQLWINLSSKYKMCEREWPIINFYTYMCVCHFLTSTTTEKDTHTYQELDHAFW